MADDDSYEVPPYSMDFSTFGRINFTLWMCNNSKINDKLTQWKNSVLVLFSETETNMSDSERQTYKEMSSDFEKTYQKYVSFVSASQNRPDALVGVSPPNVGVKLLNIELFLRRILDRKGLLRRKGEDVRKQMI